MVRTLFAGLSAVLRVAAGVSELAEAQGFRDETPCIAVVSAFAPELEILKGELRDRAVQSANGVEFATGTLEGQKVALFLSGISPVDPTLLAAARRAADKVTLARCTVDGRALTGRRAS